MTKLKITKKYAQEFCNKCADTIPHEFLRFLTEDDEHNISLLDLIAQVETTIKLKPHHPDRDVKLDEQIISGYMNEFFSRYLPNKADEIKQILDKTHPYFIDEQGNSHVKFTSVPKGDKHSSSVGHSGRNTCLDFNVYIHNSLDDLRVTAHELTHALSSHHQHLIEMIRSNVSDQEIGKYTHRGFAGDCVGEIESHITEKLFNRFLVKKGLYTQEDLDNYYNQQQDSLLSEINVIREERDIIRNLPHPVTPESLKKLVDALQSQNKGILLERVEKMHDDNKCSSYVFRYVVGRIVSDQWIKQFENAPDTQTQVEMLNKFQSYLGSTHKLDLNSACEELLGQNFTCVVEDYVTDKINERKAEENSSQLSL